MNLIKKLREGKLCEGKLTYDFYEGWFVGNKSLNEILNQEGLDGKKIKIEVI